MKWEFTKTLKNINSIAQVEYEFGKELPKDYKDLIIEYNSGSPNPNTLDTKNKKGKAFGELLNFNLDEKDNILDNYSWIKDKLPSKVFPITVTPGGDYLCYDYRESSENPCIIYWDHEQNFNIVDGEIETLDTPHEYQKYSLDFVSNNMTELLAKLYDDIDEIDTSGFVTIWEDFLNEDELRELSDQDLADVNKRRSKEGLPPIVK